MLNSMLILTEENKNLKGSEYKLPKDIMNIFWWIVKNNPPSSDTSYVKAKNVIKNNGVVTMEWLKNMKNYFTKHKDESDPEFIKIGGYPLKYFIDSKLDQLTSSYGRAEHTNDSTKIRKDTSALNGNRGDHHSKSLSMANSLMSGLIPKFESIENNKKKIYITEKQLQDIYKVYNKK